MCERTKRCVYSTPLHCALIVTADIGEPGAWPHVSSSFGSFDVAAIPKAASFWLRSWWLSSVALGDAGRPPLPALSTATTVYLVESWQPSLAGAATRTLHAYSNAPWVALLVNGAQFGAPLAMSPFGSVQWTGVPYAPGTVNVVALATSSGPVLASHSRSSWGAPAAILLTCDAPSASTGTGSALYLDGSDVALLRATIVDADGVPCSDSSANVTFAVLSGPGLVLASVNGDPASHYANAAPWKPAYHGVVRGIVRAAVVAVGDRALLASVNVDAGGGPLSAAVLPADSAPPTALVVTATSPGLAPATLTIPLSVDPRDEVLAVAAASVALADPGSDGTATWPTTSPTATSTRTSSPTGTASLSTGASPSTSSTPTPSPSVTPSASSLVSAVVVSVAGGACLNAVEIIIVSTTGQNLARMAVVSALTTYQTQGPAFLNNGLADPTSAADVYSGTCSAAGDAVTFTLAAPAYISTIYFARTASRRAFQRARAWSRCY